MFLNKETNASGADILVGGTPRRKSLPGGVVEAGVPVPAAKAGWMIAL